ncbi:tRNA (guanine-N(7)-)-methyltransferase [Synergistales bacterium]|nr:tRNA (guanine-N(7)-)-methyltransferase [Synergistales bacterium]
MSGRFSIFSMDIDYSKILFPRKLPLDLESFGGFKKTVLEIGFGNGEYTAQYAASHDDTLVIGMEVSPSCIVRCLKRAGDLSNIKIIRADARFMMRELFPDASLDGVIMNFPCPWPKNRHAARRVTDASFADSLSSVLKPGGTFELVTDEEWYAADAASALGYFEGMTAYALETNPTRAVTTKYERKWLDMGKNITRLLVAKTDVFVGAASVSRKTWEFYRENDDGGECDMMHIRIDKALPTGGLGFLFGTGGEREEAHWAFKKSYVSSRAEDSYLIETICADLDFEQRFYLKLTERNDDGKTTTLIKPDGTSHVYLTPAVRFAIEDMANRLSTQAQA